MTPKAATAKRKRKTTARATKKAIGVRVTDSALARAKAPRRKKESIFRPALPPKGVVPAGRPTMAQDEGLGDSLAWAASVLNGSVAEGVTFLGYADLAELAQRPEYRRISETIARHMTRKWIKIKAKGDEDKSEKIARIEDAMKRLGVQDAFRKVAEQDGFFGRGHIYLDLGASDDRDELRTPIGDGHNSVSQAKVSKGSLKRLKAIEAVWCYPTNYNSADPLKPDWYKPTHWFVMGKELHVSRLLTFIGREVPDLLKPAYSFGGLSLSQMAKPYVDNWLRTRQSVADIVSAFSVFVLKTNLAQSLEVNNGDDLFKRADFFNAMRDNRGLMIVDKQDEDFQNVSASLASLDQLQAQAQEHMAAVSGIPIVELLGIQPAGLNASSEGEIRTFYDWVHSCQEILFRPNLTRVLGFVQLSEFGEVDPDITFDFEPLWSLDDKEMAETELTRAQTDAVLVDGGIISTQEARKRIASSEDSAYAGLDADDVPLPEPSELDPPMPDLSLVKPEAA